MCVWCLRESTPPPPACLDARSHIVLMVWMHQPQAQRRFTASRISAMRDIPWTLCDLGINTTSGRSLENTPTLVTLSPAGGRMLIGCQNSGVDYERLWLSQYKCLRGQEMVLRGGQITAHSPCENSAWRSSADRTWALAMFHTDLCQLSAFLWGLSVVWCIWNSVIVK